MSTVVTALALVSGVVTVVFILNGLRMAFVRHQRIGVRGLLLTTCFSLLTGAFTLWQLFQLLQSAGG
jgi:hypothetical protein